MSECERRVYRVGGHLFALNVEDGILSEKELDRYAPFRADCCCGDELLFSLRVTGEADALPRVGALTARFEDENGCMSIYSSEEGGMAVDLATPQGVVCGRVSIAAGYRSAEAWIGGSAGERRYGLDTVMMMLYAFASAERDTLLIHASAVEYEGKGYLFLGKSGTGKSTHSRLWMGRDERVSLLNDDNPVVRIGSDGKAYAYGSPWSGKTPCHIDRRVEIGGIVRLKQAPHNKIVKLSMIKAYAALLPACSCVKWDKQMAEGVHHTISRVIGSTDVYMLECLPDSEAAVLCMKTITS